MALYDAEKHRHLVGSLNHDPKTLSSVFAALAAWRLGYPDRTARLTDEGRARARRLGHPFEMGWTRTYGAEVSNYRGEPEELRKLTKEGEQIGRDNSLPVLWAILAPSETGMALIHEGKVAEGIPLITPGEMDGGHLPALAHPRELAARLETYRLELQVPAAPEPAGAYSAGQRQPPGVRSP